MSPELRVPGGAATAHFEFGIAAIAPNPGPIGPGFEPDLPFQTLLANRYIAPRRRPELRRDWLSSYSKVAPIPNSTALKIQPTSSKPPLW